MVVEQSPVFPADVQSLAVRHGTFTSRDARAHTVVHDEVNAWVASTLARDDVQRVAPTRAWCGSNGCLYRADGAYLFFDDAHFSIAGSTRAARALVDAIRTNPSTTPREEAPL